MTTPTEPVPGSGLPRPGRSRRFGRSRLAAWGSVWWVRVVLVFLAARVVSAVVLFVAWRTQGAGSKFSPDAPPTFGVFLTRWWDGWWYWQVATHGYPRTLPVDASGQAVVNTWAFFPAYPLLVRAIDAATGLGWAPAALAVSLVAGAAAMILLHALIEAGAPRAVQARPHLPLLTVALLSVFPSAALFGLAYTESLALLLLTATLLAVVRRRYWWATVGTVLLGFTRAVALPLAAVVVVHWFVVERRAQVDGARLATRQRVALAATVAAAGVAGFAWQAVAWVGTGDPSAYLDTERAWRQGRTIAPFAGWFRTDLGHARLALVAAILVGLVALLATRSARRLGPELYTWAATYPLYLVAVSDFISSQLRFWLLAFPLAAVALGMVTRPRRAAWWTALLIGGALAAQVAWILVVWVYVPGETGFWRSP